MVGPDSYQWYGKRDKKGVVIGKHFQETSALPYSFLSCSSGSFLQVPKEVRMTSSSGMPLTLIHV